MLTIDFEKFAIRVGHRVLDAGCGGGRHTFRALMENCDVWATDMSAGEIKNVKLGIWDRKNQGLVKGKCLPFRSDIFHLPFTNDFFDRIIVAEVLEHLHKDVEAIKELTRVLKPGGRMAITVPTCFTERIYRRLSNEYFNTPGGHVRIYHPFELAYKITSQGLNIYGISFAHSLHTPYWLLRCVFGLHDTTAKIPKWYHWLLVKFTVSQTMTKAEKFLNYFFPKSIVLYAYKRK